MDLVVDKLVIIADGICLGGYILALAVGRDNNQQWCADHCKMAGRSDNVNLNYTVTEDVTEEWAGMFTELGSY